MKLNKDIKKLESGIRIPPYNVHYFTDVNEKPSIDNIVEDIKDLNPDILALQKVTFGYTRFTEDKYIIKMLNEYDLISFCNTVLSWLKHLIGTLFLLKKIYTIITNE
jgi:hypothetical protein